MRTPIYDDSLEVQLTDVLCKLDDNPIVCTNPIEASTYLGFKMADTDKGFHKFIYENLYLKFVAYIESYKADCINAYAVKTHYIPLIKRIIEQYEAALDSHYNSEIRNGWTEYFSEPEKPEDADNPTRQVYQFFFNAAGVQIFYLGKVQELLNQHLAELETAVPKPEPEYFFTILPKFTKHRHNILYDIHKNLKVEGYVDCTPEAFKNIFTTTEPKPISWLKSQRSLTYLIKIMTGQFLVEKTKPSNAYITERYIHIYKKDGSLLKPKKLRHDDDPKPKVKEFLDHVIESAISSYV
jgi:hypothetical protein